MAGAQNVLGVKVQQKGETLRVDKVNPTTRYYGFAKAGTAETDPGWMIFLATLDASGDIIETLYPNGSAHYAYQWSGRAGYAYS